MLGVFSFFHHINVHVCCNCCVKIRTKIFNISSISFGTFFMVKNLTVPYKMYLLQYQYWIYKIGISLGI